MSFRSLRAAVACSIALATPLCAQTRDSTRLQEIVVTATRAPAPLGSVGSSVDRLGSRELKQRQIRTLWEALQLTPGGTVVVSGGPGGVASLFLRGVSSTQTLFLVDGMRLNDADASYASFLGGVDLAGLGRVEIVRGPESTLYGGAAIGGVVSLDAARGEGRPHGEAELEGGSFTSWRGRIQAQGGTGGLSATTAFTANGTDNQRHPNDWHQRTQLLRLDYRIATGLQAGGTFRGLQQDYASPGDLRTTNTTPAEKTTFNTELGTLWAEATPSPQWRSRFLAGLARQHSVFIGSYNGGPESAFELRNSRYVLDWQNTFTPRPEILFVGGANLEWSTATSNSDGLKQRLAGFYAEVQGSPVAPLTLTAGIRGDDYNTFASAVTYRFTAAWWIERSGTKLHGSFGTGFMPPGLTARFGGAFQNPNPDIRPERSRGWDAGIDQSFLRRRGSLSVTWFHNTLRDLLGFQNVTYPELGHSVNIDRARSSGLEVSSTVVAGPVDARLAYTLLSARSESEPDPALARLIRRPRHTASGDVLVTLSSRARLGAGIVVIANRQDTDFNNYSYPRVNPGDYGVARLHGAYDLGTRLTLQARIENLFNAQYEPVYGFPALGRNLSGSVAVRF